MSRLLTINATYAHTRVGTGTYTRNMIDALQEAHTLSIPRMLLHSNATSFWTKRATELSLAAVTGPVLHPYWATVLSREHIISALDLVQFREGTRFERTLLTASIRRSRRVLALSGYAAEQLRCEFAVDPVIAPPFPDSEWYEEAVAPPPPSGPVRIAYWGGWHKRKRMPRFLEALAASPICKSVEVHTTGSPPPGLPMQLRSHGDLTGRELVRLVDSCHLAVYPSSEEGFGLPIFESLLRNRPVVALPLPVYQEFALESDMLVRCGEITPSSVSAAIESAIAAPSRPREELLVRPTRERSIQTLRNALLSVLEPR